MARNSFGSSPILHSIYTNLLTALAVEDLSNEEMNTRGNPAPQVSGNDLPDNEFDLPVMIAVIADKTDVHDTTQGTLISLVGITIKPTDTVDDLCLVLLGNDGSGLSALPEHETLTWIARKECESDEPVQLDPWDKVYGMKWHELLANKHGIWPHVRGDARVHTKMHF